MDKSNLTALSFFVLLLCIQIEGRTVDSVLEGKLSLQDMNSAGCAVSRVRYLLCAESDYD